MRCGILLHVFLRPVLQVQTLSLTQATSWSGNLLQVMGRSKQYVSPSKKFRTISRLANFLKHKLREKIMPRLSICRHQNLVSISPVSRKLTSMVVSKLDIPPQAELFLTKPKLPKPRLDIYICSNTCDTPACQTRRRPCHDGYPSSQLYHDMIGD